VARGGIEPPTQGFSTLIDRPRFYCNQRDTAQLDSFLRALLFFSTL